MRIYNPITFDKINEIIVFPRTGIRPIIKNSVSKYYLFHPNIKLKFISIINREQEIELSSAVARELKLLNCCKQRWDY